ncbi:MAG TPA: endonuclease domain-containing protein [Pseudorhodoplanes sp.]|nr:endonuclease domain-containing protein [Pseudorhodoplanes sp.]
MVARQKEQRTWARTDRSISTPQRERARQMRREPTDAERKLWLHLRKRLPVIGTHFRRQVRIGPYIADFACHRCKVIIEVDGGQHAENAATDQKRTHRLEADGYRVLRFWNNDVLLNMDAVLAEIECAIAATPTPDPSPQGGGAKRARSARRPSPSRGG